MKTILKISAITILFIALGSCAAQKAGQKAGDAIGAETHEQAVKALDERQFIIEVNEFIKPTDKEPVKSASGSYISMQGNRATIKFAPDLSPRPPFDFENIEDDAAEITLEKRKKNGDVQYSMTVKGKQQFQDRKILITLYNNSDKCFVRVTNEALAYHVVDFTGRIHPIKAGEGEGGKPF